MTDLFRPLRSALASALVLSMALPLAAQEAAPTTAAPTTAAPAEAPAAAAPAPDSDLGKPYVAAEHGDWQQRCIHAPDDNDPCQLYQLLKDDKGNSVAEFSLFGLPEGQQAAAGATIITPLETLLTEQIVLQIDSQQAKRYPFTFCAPAGCVAQVGFTAAEIATMKKGNQAKLSIVPMGAPDQHVVLSLSLKGFTAGYDAVNAANVKARAARQAN